MRVGTWIAKAAPGESFVYAVYDGEVAPDPAEMAAARRAAAAGLVALVQRRERDRSLSYIAQRLQPPPAPERPTRVKKLPLRRCATPGCEREPAPKSVTGLCRRCGVNAARRRRGGR